MCLVEGVEGLGGLRNYLGGTELLLADTSGLLLLNAGGDPLHGELKARLEVNAGGPAEHLLDEGVVGVAATDTLGAGDVLVLEGLAGELNADVGHLVHADHLVGAKVDGLLEVRVHEAEDTLNTVIDVHEGAGLLTVAPDLELLGGGESLTAEGGGGLLATTGPGTVGAVDVVEAGDADLEAEVTAVVHGELLRGELLEAVGILGLGRPGVLLLEAGVLLVLLLGLVVHTGRGGVEHLLAASAAGSLDHVEGDHGVVVEENRVVRLDEAHATHVGGKVVDLLTSLGGLHTVGEGAEVKELELVTELRLLEELLLLPVNGNDVLALRFEALTEVGGDEATSTGHTDLNLALRHFACLLGVYVLFFHPEIIPRAIRRIPSNSSFINLTVSSSSLYLFFPFSKS